MRQAGLSKISGLITCGLVSLGLMFPALPASAIEVRFEENLDPPIRMHACAPKKFKLPRDLRAVMAGTVMVQNVEKIGSGVLVSSDGYLLTAAHVVAGASRVAIFLSSGETASGRVLWNDLPRDISLIKILGQGYPCLTMGQVMPGVGSRLYGIGLGTSENLVFNSVPATVQGYRVMDPQVPYIQLDVDLTPGYSGGPLLNELGEVVGIVSWKMTLRDSSVWSFGASAISLEQTIPITWL